MPNVSTNNTSYFHYSRKTLSYSSHLVYVVPVTNMARDVQPSILVGHREAIPGPPTIGAKDERPREPIATREVR